MKFICLHFYDRIIQVQQMLSTEPSFRRMELLHFLSIKHIICLKCCLSVFVPFNRECDYFTLLINLNGCLCSNTSCHGLRFHIHNDLGMKFGIGLITGCKFYIYDGSFLCPGCDFKGINIGVYAQFVLTDGTFKPRYILIILALCTR